MASTDAGPVTIERRPVRIDELVTSVVTEVRLARPGPSVTVDVPEGLTADLDPRLIAQVLTNLLDNATRHAGRRAE